MSMTLKRNYSKQSQNLMICRSVRFSTYSTAVRMA